MSTNGMESWAVDLADVTAVYPFQGSEMIMVVVGVVLWIGWHRIQYKREHDEQVEIEETREKIDREILSKSVERY